MSAFVPNLRPRIHALIATTGFERGITAIILANAITLGLETSPALLARFGDWFHLVDRTLLVVFVVELLARY